MLENALTHKFSLSPPILTIGNQVDPQELDWDKSFWDTESGGKEDANDFTNVGRDKITDELNKIIKKVIKKLSDHRSNQKVTYLFHVIVNGATFFNSGNNGGEVIIGEDHVGSRLGNSGTRTHSNTDFGLLQGWGIIDTITSL